MGGKQKAGQTSIGKRKGKFGTYFANTKRRKLRRILETHGKDAAKIWAEKNLMLPELRALGGM